jgi:hypothetical protein
MVHGITYDATTQYRRKPDAPTIGIIYVPHKDAFVVRYSVLHGNEQLFASKYKLTLPSENEDELRAALDRQRARLQEVQQFTHAPRLTLPQLPPNPMAAPDRPPRRRMMQASRVVFSPPWQFLQLTIL